MPDSFAHGLVGIVLDTRYRLDAVLGEGGMGAVFRATEVGKKREVAVKLLKPHLVTNKTALKRFQREARSTLRVASPHAVKVLDFGFTPQRDYYIVLELLDGRTVQRELDATGPMAPSRVLHIARQTAAALASAHESGLIHRDIKPDNLMLVSTGGDPDFTKVLDFGIAKIMESAARSKESELSITQAGTVFGTPEFMSPEQACGEPIDGRSDLYSLGATMYAMLTGRGLFRAKSAMEWLTSHVASPSPHLAEGLPALAAYGELDELVQRCLAKSPADRPADADALVREIDALAAAKPVSRSPDAFADTVIHAVTPGPEKAAASETFSMSSFIAPIPHGTSASAKTVAAKPTTTRARAPRRAVWLALGGLAIAGGAAAVYATTRTKPKPAAPPPSHHAKHAAAPIAHAGLAAPAAPLAPAAAASPVPPPPAASPAPPPPTHEAHVKAAAELRRDAAEATQRVAEAEAAKRAGHRTRWISEARAALELDPANARARLLLGEGLVTAGDLEHGCKYLRELGKSTTAPHAYLARCKGAN